MSLAPQAEEITSSAIEEHLRFPNSESKEEALEEWPRERSFDLKALGIHFDIELRMKMCF